MAEERDHRRLAAILAADVVGHSRLMEQDESKLSLPLQDEMLSRLLDTPNRPPLVDSQESIQALFLE
jgi:class 3 adenylate cyclase